MFNERKFRAQVVLAGVTMGDVAKELNIDESTLYRKIKMNGAFTREEMAKLIKFLHMEKPIEIFFDEKLAETQVEGA